MFSFNKKFNYDGFMDPECIDICNVMNSLPGIRTIESCCGHGKNSFQIFFYVNDIDVGLFFLTRCIDRRYWKYGNLWKIELNVGDMFENDKYPICYYLHSDKLIRGQEAYDQVKDLIENMNLHLNHENFKEYYKLNINSWIGVD